MADLFIGLGSNVGEREGNLREALNLLREKIKLVKISSIYETEPMYIRDQTWFVNAVAKAETELTPRELLNYFKAVERRLGRQESARFGPRTIDLDILFFGNKVVEDADLKIPHPKIQERRFVLIPLVEIDPEYVHPIYRRSVSALLASLTANESVRKLGELD